MLIGAAGVWIMYKLHYWVERTFKIDDAVGAVAVHGYAGFFGVVIAGFVLWGYPSSPTEGYAAVNPLGQFIGALIMFGLLGFLPGGITALILQGFGVLRIPREIEIQGLDFARMEDSDQGDKDLAKAERAEA